MIRNAPRWSALLAVALLAAACGEDPAVDPGTPDAGEVQSTLLLTRVGPGIIEANPGDKITLIGLLSRSEVGPVPDQAVNFRIAEDPGGTLLASDLVVTDGSGVAMTELTAGSVGTITIRASSGTAQSKAVWRIDVVPVVKRLRIVPDSITLLSNAAATGASVTAGPNQQIPLRVRVSIDGQDGERPLQNETVTFSFYNTIQGAEFVGATSVPSAASGEASTLLKVGTTTGTYKVAASIAGGLSAVWDINVTPDGNSGACNTTSQCPAGLFCIQGTCSTPGGGGSCGTNDRPCPLGYMCNPTSGQCEIAMGEGCENCPNGFHCDESVNACVPDNPECSGEVPCPSGFECVNGLCNPTDGSINVTGHWYTKHFFNVREAMPSWLQFSAGAIRTIDQILLGQLDLPSWVNSLIRGLVQQYVPEWVVTVVGILDAAATVFSTLEAEGEMDLFANGSQQLLVGQEYWTSFVFYFLPLCQGNIGGSANSQPPCARMDIYMEELEQADLAVEVKPFTAKVAGSSGNYTLVVDPREVNMKFAGILKYVLDYAIQISTGYESLADALPNIIDCEGINALVQDIIPIDVTGLCQVAVRSATQAIVNQLQNAVVQQKDALSFNGKATARPTTSNASYANELGYADYLTRSSPDGEWTGRFKILLSVKNVPGRWRASRDPFPYQY